MCIFHTWDSDAGGLRPILWEALECKGCNSLCTLLVSTNTKARIEIAIAPDQKGGESCLPSLDVWTHSPCLGNSMSASTLARTAPATGFENGLTFMSHDTMVLSIPMIMERNIVSGVKSWLCSLLAAWLQANFFPLWVLIYSSVKMEIMKPTSCDRYGYQIRYCMWTNLEQCLLQSR